MSEANEDGSGSPQHRVDQSVTDTDGGKALPDQSVQPVKDFRNWMEARSAAEQRLMIAVDRRFRKCFYKYITAASTEANLTRAD